MRLISVGVCVLLVALLLAGCGKKEEAADKEGGEPATTESADRDQSIDQRVVDETDSTSGQNDEEEVHREPSESWGRDSGRRESIR